MLSEKYRVVGIDVMGLGTSTRSTSKAAHKTPELAEAWIQDYYTKLINAMDMPEKFFLVGHSWGGYSSMMIASIMPHRLEALFLLSPAGNEGYRPETYEKRLTTVLS
jgi:pimeloyl-ACP methyl ester carboxylesterase